MGGFREGWASRPGKGKTPSKVSNSSNLDRLTIVRRPVGPVDATLAVQTVRNTSRVALPSIPTLDGPGWQITLTAAGVSDGHLSVDSGHVLMSQESIPGLYFGAAVAIRIEPSEPFTDTVWQTTAKEPESFSALGISFRGSSTTKLKKEIR